MNIFEINKVSINYGQVSVIEDLSLSISDESIVTLIGANGAGKSTVLKTISGLVRPISGEIWFSGKRIDVLPVQKIVKMGIAHCPEGRRIFPDITVVENLKAGAILQKNRHDIEKIKRTVFDYFPVLGKRKSQRAGTLSGGEQQMLAIGRALMSTPKFLLLDEPSLGLAPLLVRQIAFIIKEIHKNGISVLLVEQNAQMALRLSSYAYVIETGRIALDGPSMNLLSDEYVKKAYLGG